MSYEFTFTKKTASTYYAVVWVDSGTSGNYRFDNISVTLGTQSSAITTCTLTYDANGGSGTMAATTHDPGSTFNLAANTFTREGYTFSGWNTAADGSGTSYAAGDSFTITANTTLYAQWEVHSTHFTLFHEGFGNNSESARAWDDAYREQSGVASVYANASYTITNAKQSKNTVGAVKSGLTQTSSSTPGEFIVGPLNLSSYADGTDVTLSYKWKATSVNASYETKVYYATSSTGTYTEIPNSAEGKTTFVDVEVDVPAEALVSTAYFKVEFNTSNTQAIIDEFDLSGKESKALPTAYFDLPVHYVYAADVIDLPAHESVSSGAVTHVSADTDVATIDHANATLHGGDNHGTATIVTATIAETDEHASATASYIVKVVPHTVAINHDYNYTAFSNEYNLDFSAIEDIKPYAITKFEAPNLLNVTCAIIEEIDGQQVPAKNGVILQGKTGTYDVPVIISASPIKENNRLIGALKDEEIPASDGTFSRFTFDEPGCTYVLLTDTPATEAAARKSAPLTHDDTAYLEVPATVGEALPATMPISLGGDNGACTGVDAIVAENLDADATYYNLQGMLMPASAITPGIYIKVKGGGVNKVYINSVIK